MALPHRVAKVTLSGDAFGGSEIWSTGFHMGFENADAPALTEQGAADIGEAFATFFRAQTSSVSDNYSFKLCKLSMLNNDGRVMADSSIYYQPLNAVVGAVGGPSLPPQVSLVATLANSLPRGLATKGRMFLPGINAPIDDSGHLPALYTQDIATNLQAFFNTIFQDADTPGNPVLASVGRGPLNMDGAIRNVTQIRIGNVYDTQRRRRNALQETYKVLPVSVG
jgi:hypothetical protein